MLPPWDCLPYDRAGPSPEIMGRRIATLRRLTEQPRSQRLLITTIDAVMQRLPPRSTWSNSGVSFQVGQELLPDQLEVTLLRLGYRLDERVDEPGEAAIRSEVADMH